MPRLNITDTIATELKVKPTQVQATIDLLEEGATIPFIARYRKEVTGNLSDTALRDLFSRLTYLRELEARRETILKSIEEQGKLTPELKTKILKTESKTTLEDLYLPYKPKRRTKAQIAREAGLEPLALLLLKDLNAVPEECAAAYINEDKGVADVGAALDGARQIIMEMFAEDAGLLAELRDMFWKHAVIISKVSKGKEEEGAKFADYFDFSEAIQKIPSHRMLAILRGRNEKLLSVDIDFADPELTERCYRIIAKAFAVDTVAENSWLWQTVTWAWKIKLHLRLELDAMAELKAKSDDEAIKVFRDNLHNLLMAAPAGNHVVMGLDPGFRTGVKVVVVDGTGKLLDHIAIFPHAPQKQWDKALHTLASLCQRHQVKLISIGNGTASRETDQLAAELIAKYPAAKMTKIVVSEAGASVYSASQLAADEFPDLDVSYRGAVSIARRLQDPLAELVKIDPKAIGVGQYQHDVLQKKLEISLDATVEDCVNAVGADINTASVPLLTSISGLNKTIANNIVKYRESNGRFKDRNGIKAVPRLGDKTFEQAAGFLRILDGENPLDRSAVHPESYAIVELMAKAMTTTTADLIGNEKLLNSLNHKDFVTEQAGLLTIRDIVDELKKPGRDPRPEFQMAKFAEGINEVKDLKPGMELEGVITNVANFGAFVDIGVHQDGLVHVSQLADHFVKDVHQEVKVGQIVKVRVLEVDEARARISLSMKSKEGKARVAKPKINKAKQAVTQTLSNSMLGDQLQKAFKKQK